MADTVVWSIRDGDYPFLDEFPVRYDMEYTSDVLWQISDSNYPYKKSFPQMMGFTEVPDTMWAIQDGELPYKLTFPTMYPFVPFSRGFSNVYHKEGRIHTMYKEDSNIEKAYLGDISVFAYARPIGT